MVHPYSGAFTITKACSVHLYLLRENIGHMYQVKLDYKTLLYYIILSVTILSICLCMETAFEKGIVQVVTVVTPVGDF